MLKTMITGSLPRPTWLAPQNQISSVSLRLEADALHEGQDDAVRLAVADQHEAGMDIVTDGEQRRRHYIWGFTEGLTGIDFNQMVKKETRGGRYTTQIAVARVTGPVRRPHSVFLDALRFLKQHTTRPVKVTLPGPMTTADTLADEYYGETRRLAADLASVLNDEAHELAENGCDIIQFDEPCFNIYLDAVGEWVSLRSKPRPRECLQRQRSISVTAMVFPRSWRGRQRIRIGIITIVPSHSCAPVRLI